ncbi:MAG: AAA family ATPase [Mycobacterium sp.]
MSPAVGGSGAVAPGRWLTEPGLIGRRSELAVLQRQAMAAGKGRGTVVGLGGPAGVGKSMLLDAVAAGAGIAGITVLRGTTPSHGPQRPLGLFGTVFDDLADLLRARSDVAAEIARVHGGLIGSVVGLVPQLARALGGSPADVVIPGPEVTGALTVIAEILGDLFTATQPGLLILDDCQSADELSWRLLGAIARSVQRSETEAAGHLTVLCAFRPEAWRQVRSWDQVSVVSIELGGMDADESRDLIGAAAARPVPPVAVDYVLEQSCGNPYYMISTLRALIESDVLVDSAGRWTVHEDNLRLLAPIARPEFSPDIQSKAFLLTRLAQMTPRTRSVLEQTAVLGGWIVPTLLAEALDLDLGTVEAAVEECAQRGFVSWPSEGSRIVEIANGATRDAVLQFMGAHEVRSAHRRAASALRRRQSADDHALAYHLHKSGASTQALPHALRAGEAALRQHALDVAETYLAIGRAGLEGDPEATDRDRFRVCEGLGTLYMLQGSYDAAAEHLDLAYEAAGGLDPIDRGRVAIARGELSFKKGQLDDADLWTARAVSALELRHPASAPMTLVCAAVEFVRWCGLVALAAISGPPRRSERAALAARLYNRLSYQSWFSSSPAWNLWGMLRALRFAQASGSVQQLSQAYSGSGACLAGLAPVLAPIALRLVDRSLRMRRALHDKWGIAQSRHFRGFVLLAASRFDEASTEFDAAIAAFGVLGDRWEQIAATWQKSLCLYHAGQLSEAGALARDAFWESRLIGDRIGAGTSLALWVRCMPAGVGADALARELESSAEPDAHTRALLRAAMGWRLLHLDRADAALAEFEAAQRERRRARIRNHFVAPLWTGQVQAQRLARDARPSWSAKLRRRDEKALRRSLFAALVTAAVFSAQRPAVLRECALASLAHGRICRARIQLWAATRSARRLAAHGEFLACQAVLQMAFGTDGTAATRTRSITGIPANSGIRVDRGFVECLSTPVVAGPANASRHGVLIAAARRFAGLETAGSILEELRRAVYAATPALDVQVLPEAGPECGSEAVERFLAPITVLGSDEHILAVSFPFGEACDHVPAVEVLAALAGALLERQKLRSRVAEQMVEVQEAERARIARDLHDDLGHVFSGILEGLRRPTNAVGGIDAAAVSHLRDIAREGIRTVRTVAWSLRPEALEDLGVAGCIEQLVEDCERMFGIRIDLTMRCDDRTVSPRAETALFRIVQEALTNVGRHSGAREASVLLVRSAVGLRAVVEDYGAGFDTAQVQSRSSLGLSGMRERARLVGGRLDVVSRVGGGTTVMVEVPVDT